MSENTISLEECRRRMLADQEGVIESAARDLNEKSGLSLDAARDFIRTKVMEVLPMSTRIFLAGGELPDEPD